LLVYTAESCVSLILILRIPVPGRELPYCSATGPSSVGYISGILPIYRGYFQVLAIDSLEIGQGKVSAIVGVVTV
jgi:hypothetical protein